MVFSINNLSKKINLYTFVESIKNQIQIIKINDISLDSPIGTIFVFGNIYCNSNNNNNNNNDNNKMKVTVTVIL